MGWRRSRPWPRACPSWSPTGTATGTPCAMGLMASAFPTWAPRAESPPAPPTPAAPGTPDPGLRQLLSGTAATSVDIKQLSDRLTDLVEQPDLRRRMGEAGYARARETLRDCAADLQAVPGPVGRTERPPHRARRNPGRDGLGQGHADGPPSSRLDPFRAFGHYPTHHDRRRRTVRRVLRQPGATLDEFHSPAQRRPACSCRSPAPASLSRRCGMFLSVAPRLSMRFSAAAALSLG